MNKKQAKELVIKWAEIMGKGAGTGLMSHPSNKERYKILEAVNIMKSSKPSHNSSSKKDCFNSNCSYHRGKSRCVQPIDNTNCEIIQSSPS
jgi:hypothetical protein